ncbi:MAG: hypothetical protein IPQ09_23120 [Myxococcales bacterium]|nr:hypothetical protein [Myxococcales bacterium]
MLPPPMSNTVTSPAPTSESPRRPESAPRKVSSASSSPVRTCASTPKSSRTLATSRSLPAASRMALVPTTRTPSAPNAFTACA